MKSIAAALLSMAMVAGVSQMSHIPTTYAAEEPYVELSSTLTAKDTFAWIEFDHDNYYDPYFKETSDHIIIENNDIIMYGYGAPAYKDFLFVDSDKEVNSYTDLKQTFSFDIARNSTSWHSMECGGFLFNTSIKNDIMNGFAAVIANGKFHIVKLANVDVNKFHEGKTGKMTSTSIKSVSFANNTDTHNIKIEIENDNISVFDGNTEIISDYELPETEHGYGFGPITSYESHGCSEKSFFTFGNIKMEQVEIRYIPQTPLNLNYSVNGESVILKWNQPEGKAIAAGYNIYRNGKKIGSSETTEFTDIPDNIEEASYYVEAFDSENYTSEKSETVYLDGKKPEIISFCPEDNTVLENNQIIGVYARDNLYIDNIIVEYRHNKGEWQTAFVEDDIKENSAVVRKTIDTSEFSDGDYEFRAYAVDYAGNTSDYAIADCTYKKCRLSVPVLSVSGEGWRNELNWTMTDTTDISSYRIYRKSGSSDYTLISSVTETSYTDSELVPGTEYTYLVSAVDIRNNEVSSTEMVGIPTEDDDIKPIADAGFDAIGLMGEGILFDALKSWDNNYIYSYLWDFGDGTTSTELSESHVYNKAGVYNVKLTVSDIAGNTDTHTIKANVYDENNSYADIKVVDKSGRPLPNVMIYCELPDTSSTNFVTDSNGNFKLVAPVGSYDVYFYRTGYEPICRTINVTAIPEDTITVALEAKSLLSKSNVTVKTLDINQIEALGIDVTDPDNQVVYEYTIDLDEDGEITLTVDATGGIIGNVGGTISETKNGVTTVVKTLIGNSNTSESISHGGSDSSGSSSESGRGGGLFQGSTNLGGNGVSVAVFRVSTELSWLKQFYDIDLTVINDIGNDFYIDNASAVLNVPDGLSLADTSRTENLKKNLGKIGGSETKNISWFLRGDKPGSYDISAELTGALMPFNAEIDMKFVSEEPLVVSDGEDLDLDIDVVAGNDYWTNSFTFTNNSDRPIYNFAASFSGSAEFAEFTSMYIEYPSGIVETVEINEGVPDLDNADVFYPALIDSEYESIYEYRTIDINETVTGYFSVNKEKK